MQRLVCRSKLIHGDLSPYNILIWNDDAYVIDVSQAVLLSHPDAGRFLRDDLRTMSNFFEMKGVDVKAFQQLEAKLMDQVR